MTNYLSWGRYPVVDQDCQSIYWQDQINDELIPSEPKEFLLCQGLGRSYGDVCLNDAGKLLRMSALDKIIAFDAENGLLRAEAGLSLESIINIAAPKGWFLPVSPGTKYVTLGGAIANDIHGKNHHCAGTFGCFVEQIKIWRSDLGIVTCSLQERPELFSATIGGLGLTGMIVECTIKLKPIVSALIDAEFLQFKGLDHFFKLSESSAQRFEYTVAWLDCVSSGDNFARGIFIRGNHSSVRQENIIVKNGGLPLAVPFDFPSWALNPYSIAAFNQLYYHKQMKSLVRKQVGFDSFFYPLDGVSDWNKIYGKRGFFQFQCVVPRVKGQNAIKEILEQVVECGNASFLAVLKEFGEIKSPGLLSFPRPGVTLCLDFPNTPQSEELLQNLEQLVTHYGGAMYPAKDALLRPESFKTYFPSWQEFLKQKDPKFSSVFSRRIFGE